MSREVLVRALDFMAEAASDSGDKEANVIFHGGEPLVAGILFWKAAIEGLEARFDPRGFQASVQSNLWLLDDRACELFVRGRIEVGTSLDGPRGITDAQRGEGYYDRTMAGIRKAREHGIDVTCIATFTRHSVRRWREVFDFFLDEGLDFSVHPSVPTLTLRDSSQALSCGEYSEMLLEMLDYYIEHRHKLSVLLLDQIFRSVASGCGQVCTFRDCLGMFLAIDPEGHLYPCQRFVGSSFHRIGTLNDAPNPAAIFSSPRTEWMQTRQQLVATACRDCSHFAYCRGGCAYNAFAAGDMNGRDPYCDAYKGVFNRVIGRLLDEVGREENLNALAKPSRRNESHPLFRRGPLTELAYSSPHPSEVSQTAKRIVAAVEMAKGPDIASAGERLVRMGICHSHESAEISLASLQAYLKRGSLIRNNLYLHVTFRCQLQCSHCYACAEQANTGHGPLPNMEMSPTGLASLVYQAKVSGFRQVVITGGEPLVHRERNDVLRVLQGARKWTSPMNVVLRSNLAMPLTDVDILRIARAADQLVVSVDGNQSSHDARRGQGSYQAVVANLQRYVRLADDVPSCGELSLAAVLTTDDVEGAPGIAVRHLAETLGVRRVRFRPILPIGRASDWNHPPVSEALDGHKDPKELIEGGFLPVASCGLGHNLYVEPDGESFPCYASHTKHSLMGNVFDGGLARILNSSGFSELSCYDVDTNEGCKTCNVRYLCGGACKAWGGRPLQHNRNATPLECGNLHRRASRLYQAARDWLVFNM